MIILKEKLERFQNRITIPGHGYISPPDRKFDGSFCDQVK